MNNRAQAKFGVMSNVDFVHIVLDVPLQQRNYLLHFEKHLKFETISLCLLVDKNLSTVVGMRGLSRPIKRLGLFVFALESLWADVKPTIRTIDTVSRNARRIV